MFVVFSETFQTVCDSIIDRKYVCNVLLARQYGQWSSLDNVKISMLSGG